MSSTTYDDIRDAYDLVYADTYKKVPFLVDILKKHQVQSALELGSGSGLFSIPLKQAGFAIEGVEISQEMIAFMEKKNVGIPIHHGNIQNYQLHQQYDAVLLLSSILVLLDSHDAMGESLRCSYDHLLPKGIFFLELPNHKVEVEKSNFQQEVHTSEDQSIIVVMQSQATEKFWREHWYIYRQEGETFSQETTICDELLYSPETLQVQLQDTGFEIIETYGDLFGNPFDENTSWRRVWVCQKK